MISNNRTVFRTHGGNGLGFNFGERMIRGYFRFEPGDAEAQEKIEALIEAGVTSGNIFFETTGAEELNRLLRLLRRGDTLVVSRAADVCRCKEEMALLIERLERKGAAIRALDEPWLDFNRGVAGEMRSKRGMELGTRPGGTRGTKRPEEGMEDARAAGRPKGPHREIMHKLDFAIRMYNTNNQMSVSEICKTVELNERTFYRHLEREGIQVIRRPKGRKPKAGERR